MGNYTKGSHSIAVGVDAPLDITVHGTTGYYCAGMNKQATIRIKDNAGPGVAENMMGGSVIIDGDASQYAGATGRGGLLVIKGNAASRSGISMKRFKIVVHGNIGHISALMAQTGALVVCGDAGEALGDHCTRRGCVCADRSNRWGRKASRKRYGRNIWHNWRTRWIVAHPMRTPRTSSAVARPGNSILQHRQRGGLLMQMRNYAQCRSLTPKFFQEFCQEFSKTLGRPTPREQCQNE